MKKWFGILLGLVLIAVPVVAFACHALLTVNTPACETVASSYEFQGDGGSRWFRGVASGDLASFTTDATRSGAVQTGTIFNGTKPAGTYSETFKMQVAPNVHTNEVSHMACPAGYEPSSIFPNKCYRWQGWDLVYVDKVKVVDTPASDKPGTFADYPGASQTKTVTVVACYVECAIKVDGTPGEWSDWSYDPGRDLNFRTRTIPLVDSKDPAISCGSRIAEETDKPVYGDQFTVANDCEKVVVTQHFYRDGEEYTEPVMVETFVWADQYTTETFQSAYVEGLIVEPKTCEKTHCDVIGTMWYQCNSGAWLYGTGALRDCPWCGGLNGTRVVKESYDCGETWYYYLNGVPVSAPPQPLGRYSCNTKDCFGK